MCCRRVEQRWKRVENEGKVGVEGIDCGIGVSDVLKLKVKAALWVEVSIETPLAQLTLRFVESQTGKSNPK